MWIRAFRFHFTVAWVLILALAEWRLGSPRTGFDVFLAIAMQVLCFPAGIIAGAVLAFARIDPAFWDTRAGTAAGWALFFAAGFVQWFVLVPWFVRKVRKRPDPQETEL